MSTLLKITSLCLDFSNNLHFVVIAKTLSGKLFVILIAGFCFPSMGCDRDEVLIVLLC